MSGRGYFITLEGPEGSGKSTQIGLLVAALEAKGHKVVRTAEPGGDPLAQEIRQIVLHSKSDISPEAELLLYLAARAQHVKHIIQPALAEGKVVVSDRYADSTIAYQGYARGLDIDAIRELNDFATGGLVPDLTIFLDIPVEIGLNRQSDKNRFEAESVAFHNKVRQGFIELSKAEPERWVVIDATGTIEEVTHSITKAVKDRLQLI